MHSGQSRETKGCDVSNSRFSVQIHPLGDAGACTLQLNRRYMYIRTPGTSSYIGADDQHAK